MTTARQRPLICRIFGCFRSMIIKIKLCEISNFFLFPEISQTSFVIISRNFTKDGCKISQKMVAKFREINWKFHEIWSEFLVRNFVSTLQSRQPDGWPEGQNKELLSRQFTKRNRAQRLSAYSRLQSCSCRGVWCRGWWGCWWMRTRRANHKSMWQRNGICSLSPESEG